MYRSSSTIEQLARKREKQTDIVGKIQPARSEPWTQLPNMGKGGKKGSIHHQGLDGSELSYNQYHTQKKERK